MPYGFVRIWHDWTLVTEELNDQEKGRLIDAIVMYDAGGDWESRLKGGERYLFPAFREAINREREERRQKSVAGKRSAEAKAEQRSTGGNTGQHTSTEGNTGQHKAAQPSSPEQPAATVNQKKKGEQKQQTTEQKTTTTTVTPVPGESPPPQSPPPERRTRTKPNPALDYTQRTYTENELNRVILNL